MEHAKQSTNDKFEHLVGALHEYQDALQIYKDLLNNKEGSIPKWSYAHLYKISRKDESVNDMYIGSSAQIPRAMGRHKSYCNNAKHKMHGDYLYQIIREHGGVDTLDLQDNNYNFVVSNENEGKLKRRMPENLKASLNSYIPVRSEQERYNLNRGVIM